MDSPDMTTNKILERGRGHGHVTRQIFGCIFGVFPLD